MNNNAVTKVEKTNKFSVYTIVSITLPYIGLFRVDVLVENVGGPISHDFVCRCLSEFKQSSTNYRLA